MTKMTKSGLKLNSERLVTGIILLTFYFLRRFTPEGEMYV